MLRVPTLVMAASTVLLVACGGHTSKPTSTPNASAAATSMSAGIALSDLRTVLPPGWALEDWAASSDAQYLAVTETAAPGSGDRVSTMLSIFQRSADGGFAEAGRFLGGCCSTYLRPRIVADPQVLAPDAAGVRRLTVHFYDPDGSDASFLAHFSVDAAGNVTTDRTDPPPPVPLLNQPPRRILPHAANGTLAADPVRLAAIQPDLRFPSDPPSPPPVLSAVMLPAGAVPPGWRLLQGAVSTDGKAFAVVTDSPLETGEGDVLSVYEIVDGRLVERWRKVDSFIDLDAVLTFHDLNGDGMPDVVYRSSNGGNGATQGGTYAATLHPDGSVADLRFNLPIGQSAPRGPIDINHDGVYEWTAVDASWELTAFCHACSPYSEFILAWDGTTYSDASTRFGDEILAQHADPLSPAPGASCRDQDSYLSALVGRYLDYWNAGRKDEAARMREQVRTYDIDVHLVSKRDVVLRALADDPHRSLSPAESAAARDCPPT